MRIKLDPGAYAPKRAHETDAGYDIYSRETKCVPAHGSAVYDTGVHIELPEGTWLNLKSRSGLNVKHGITGEGVIDESYRGAICVKLYNHTDHDFWVEGGDRIIQGIITPYVAEEIEIVDELDETDRGSGGFGSTGR